MPLFRRGLKKRPRANSKLAVPQTMFDKKGVTEKMVRKACDEAADQLFSTALEVDRNVNQAVGRLLVATGDAAEGASEVTRFVFGRKLGEGSFGSVYALNGELSNTVVKVIEYAKELRYSRTPHDDWLVTVLSEAALLRVFSASGTGPRVPAISATMSPDRKVAYLLMEKADGDVNDLYKSLVAQGRFASYKPTLERQIRKRVTEAVRVGVVCTDMKPLNMLFKRRAGGKISVMLSDFDARFCCSLSDSIAREVLTQYGVVLPLRFREDAGRLQTFERNEIEQSIDILPGRLDGATCPRKSAEAVRKTVFLTLGLIGGWMGIFKKENKFAADFLEDRKNRFDPLYRVFIDRWNHYKHLFVSEMQRPEWEYES